GSGSDAEAGPKPGYGEPLTEVDTPPRDRVAPPPPPAQKLPRPPPPVIGRADLVITVTVNGAGRALVSARRGDEAVGMYATHQDRAGEQVQEIVNNQAVKEEPVKDNAV